MISFLFTALSVLIGLGTGQFAFGKQYIPLFGKSLVPEYLLGVSTLDLLVKHPYPLQEFVHLFVDVEENRR